MISGLGKYADEFKHGVNAQSYIIKSDEYKNSGKTEADYTDNTAEWSAVVPQDAEQNKYMDVHNDSAWASATGDYAGIVNLVSVLRGGAASTSPAKKFFKYMRPFRWSRKDASLAKVTILPSLTTMEKQTRLMTAVIQADILMLHILLLSQWHIRCLSSIQNLCFVQANLDMTE